jgi:hypothetical protein
LGQAPVELDEIERAGWWAFPVGPVLGRSAASAADAGGSVRSPDRAAGFEKHGVVPALVEVVAVGQAGAGAQGGGQGELVEVGAVVELVEGIGVVQPSTVRLVFPIPASPETSTTEPAPPAADATALSSAASSASRSSRAMVTFRCCQLDPRPVDDAARTCLSVLKECP